MPGVGTRVNVAFPMAMSLVVIAVIWVLPYLSTGGELGVHFVSIGSSLLVAGALILLFHGWLNPDDGDDSLRATLAGTLTYASLGYGMLAALAVLPDRVGGFHSLGDSFGGWLTTVLTWPFVGTWMAACTMGVTGCPA